MRAFDEDALICDFAQFYTVHDIDDLPLLTQAILAEGLPTESRIKKKMADVKYDFNTLLLAGILDMTRIQNYKGTKDARNHTNKPESILSRLLGKEENTSDEIKTFRSGEDFERYRKKLIEMGG